MAEQTVSIDEALHAYGVVQLLKDEVARMEDEVQKYYKLANEYLEKKDLCKSNFYRHQGDTLMERVVALKQIMG